MDKIRNLISQIKTFKLKDIKAIKNSSNLQDRRVYALSLTPFTNTHIL